MKKLLLFSLICLLFSCSSEPTIKIPEKVQQFRTATYYKVVKSIKEKNEQTTDYEYKYDWLNGKFRQQPNISSKTKYFAIYTDGTYEEVSMSQSVILSVGDTVSKIVRVPI